MLIKEAIQFGKTSLETVTDVPVLETEWLLEWLLSENRIYLLLNGDKELPEDIELKFRQAIKRRTGGEPLQYIIGTQEFMGLSFEVTPDVLIPRRDTECLVELIVESVQDKSQPMTISDLGSGSGAIGVSLAYFLPKAEVTCVDLSKGALAMTQQNGSRLLEDRNPERFKTVWQDMFDYLSELMDGSQDIIVSNPPYIPSADIEGLQTEVKCHEPHTALDGGVDGLDYYRRLVTEAKQKLKPSGWMLFEVGHDQAEAVAQLFLDDGGYCDIQCYRDLQGVQRIVGAHKCR